MKKVLLAILDGFGEAPAGPGNAVRLAKTPHLDQLREAYPFSFLEATGEAVGLTEGSMGGSEVGHFTLGSGRVTPQFLLAINRAIADGSFFENEALKGAFEHAAKEERALHLLGMISDKGVHSHIEHLFALLEWAKKAGLKKVYVHAIADGRDVEEQSVIGFLEKLDAKMTALGVGKLATLVGRYYSMDRDKNWDRTEVAYRLMAQGEGESYTDVIKAVKAYYASGEGVTDYYLPPLVLDKEGLVKEEDALIFFNYRTDRTRQTTSVFTDAEFSEFQHTLSGVHFVCMGPYSDHASIAFNMPVLKNNLSQWFSSHKIRQLRVAETEKYAHVTYFFNSQIEHAVEGEDRVLVPSRKVASFAEVPEMSAGEITDKVVEAMKKGEHQAIIVNYANGDLVGHSGDLKASIKAVEALDEVLGRLWEEAKADGTVLLVTADHGNVEDMLYPDGSQKPAHSMNRVIFLVCDPSGTIKNVRDGGLADVAPTLLKILEMPQPEEMTGVSLIEG